MESLTTVPIINRHKIMSITLNTKVYNFAGFDSQSISHYRNTDSGVPAGFSDLTARVDYGTGTNNTKVRWKLKLPVVATVDTDCSCAGSVLREYITDIVVTVPAGATAAERTDLEARIADLVASSEFSASIASLIQPSA